MAQRWHHPLGKDAKAFRIKASRYTLIQDVLFEVSVLGVYLRCLEAAEAKQVLEETHCGVGGNHAAGRSLSTKIHLIGYYLPTMRQDAADIAEKGDDCQQHAPVQHHPSETLHPTLTPCLFMQWGMAILGKLPQALDKKIFMLAMTDYFLKWIEAEAFK